MDIRPHYPLVSIVIPAYNAAKFIGETIESALHQTYNNLEVIVVDDGSEDDTCSEVIKNAGQVRLVRQKNAGPSAARNRGIREARGEYVALLDADDLWLPEKTTLQMKCLERYPEAGLVFSDMIEFHDDKRESPTQFSMNGLNEAFFGHQELVPNPFYKLMQVNFISTPSVLLRKSVFEQTGGFDEAYRFSEDFLLWLRFAKISPLVRVDKPLVLRRRHEGNLTNSRLQYLMARPNILLKIRNEHADFLASEGIPTRAKLAIAYMELGKFLLASGEESRGRREMAKGFMTYPSVRRLCWLIGAFTGLGAHWAKNIRKRSLTGESSGHRDKP
jgi:glycosyltransferase involved in cell wall biosynthesis